MTMSVREKAVELLAENAGHYVSGEEMAASLSVTRAAVWKAVEALREEGMPIEAATKKGYRLPAEWDEVSASGIKQLLKYPLEVEKYRTLSSTNAAAKERAASGAPEGLVVIAESQTAGRGRLGRSFHSPRGSGLYMSLLLRPKIAADMAVLITTAAAVAVAETVEALSGKKAGIKWVNDIFVDGRKICGILTEASFGLENGGLEYAVLGIGVDLYPPEEGLPENIASIAGAVFDKKTPKNADRLAAGILNRFMELYPALEAGAFVEEYRRRSLVIGKRVKVISASGSREALAVGIDGQCRLAVRYEDGREALLSSGEISIKL